MVWIGRIARWPALHYAIIGTLLFVVWSLKPVTSQVDDEAGSKTRIVIPASRIELMRQEYTRLNRRTLSAKEASDMMRTIVNEELLYQHALKLGLTNEPVVQRRLAQIASFVAANPHDSHGPKAKPFSKIKSFKSRADEAIKLGLHHSDMVVRRILVDSARRLIKAAVRVREPTQEALETYWRAHQAKFQQPAAFRITHVELSHAKHKDNAEAQARIVLDRLRAESIPPEASARFSDPSFVPLSLPLLSESELARRLGYRFASRITELGAGSWQGPVASNYGMHLVFIQEHHQAHAKPLLEVRDKVRAQVIEQLADEWLDARLEQLRDQYEVVIGVQNSI